MENKLAILADSLDTKEREAFIQIAHGYDNIIKGLGRLGCTIEDDNFKDTAYRCAKAMIQDFVIDKQKIRNICEGYVQAMFPANFDEMVVETGIHAVSLCPHHLLPVEMIVNIGYIPGDKVLGISKLARLAKMFAKQPILQEQYGEDIANFIMNNTGAKGVGVNVHGIHGCMKFRGVAETNVVTITSALRGNFKDLQATRNEFLSLCKRM